VTAAAQLLTQLTGPADAGPVTLTGARGGFAAVALAHLRASLDRPLVVVVPTAERARELREALAFYAPKGQQTVHYRALDHTPFLGMSPSRSHVLDRTSTLFRAVNAPTHLTAVVVEAAALLDRVPPLGVFTDLAWQLKAGGLLDRDAFVHYLAAAGYHAVENVEDPGSFALRGGIVDVFVPHLPRPLRIDLWGDEIDTLKWFDPETQRSLPQPLKSAVAVAPARTIVLSSGDALKRVRHRVLDLADELDVPTTRARAMADDLESGVIGVGAEDLLPLFYDAPLPALTEALSTERFAWVVEDLDRCAGAVERGWEQYAEHNRAARAEGRMAAAIETVYAPAGEVVAAVRGAVQVRLEPFESAEAAANTRVVPFPAEDNRDIRKAIEAAMQAGEEHILAPLAARIRQWRNKGLAVAVCAHTAGGAERLMGLLGHVDLAIDRRDQPFSLDRVSELASAEADVAVFVGEAGRGFRSEAIGLVLLDEAEILGRRSRRRQKRRFSAEESLTSWRDLREGDLVVHLNHGVGRYHGLVKTNVGSHEADFLVLEYAGADKLYVPVEHLHLVSKHIGADSKAAKGSGKLDTLGGARWQATRRKVKKAVRDIADRLLKLYAERELQEGYAFSQPGEYFAAFEAAFPYEETPDQDKAIGDVLTDMQKLRPMDRVVCGDVGFGKTEVAMRAAFKAVLDGKQVAILVPTVVLAEQHRLTLERRFRDFPVRIASYTRSKTGAVAREIREGLASGGIDVVVGTHKLLAKNIAFDDLGLLIIDEEHRFGVTHKERLKEYRSSVDVLTLTATPIPRTLHLSMVGLRDLSLIQTPPAERLAVRTVVAQPSDAVIADAIERELARGGQVYFVHNRVEDLETKAELIRRLVPKARIIVGHGQMEKGKLEDVMLRFMRGEANVLVCTTVIESGIDIPLANTMLISRADRFGLAQLYQLRGRVGRSSERAYCYLLVPAPRNLTGDAAERIGAIQRFSTLGSGFSVAGYDLDIRGSGDILGADQSGHINAVGYDGYLQLLKEAVQILRAEQDDQDVSAMPEPELKIAVEARIPSTWLPETTLRLRLYRALAGADTIDRIYDLYQDAVDRFGKAPQAVDNLVELMVVRVRAKWLGLSQVAYGKTQLTFGLAKGSRLTADKLVAFVNRPGQHYQLTPAMQLTRRVTPAEWDNGLAGLADSLKELEMFASRQPS